MSNCLCLNCKKDANSLVDSVKTRSKNRREKLTKLIEKNPRDIIYTLMLNNADGKKGLEFSQIVSNVSKSPSTVSIYLSQLIRDSIVKITLGFDRKRKYHISDKQLVDKLIENHKPGMLEKPVSGFEDMINSL